MIKFLFRILFFAVVGVLPVVTMAAEEISVGIALPPPMVFSTPPEVVVLPDTDVYVVPDVDEEIYFYGGWWWRPWQGRWYRSEYYDREWRYYDSVPSFYLDVDLGCRGFYRNHEWYGQRWSYERIPHQELWQDWMRWQNDRHWEKQGSWGVEGYRARPQPQRQQLRDQRWQQYHQRPEVRQHQQQRHQQNRK